MMKKRGGSIVNISSIVGVHGNWGQTNYAASKAGIIGFTKSLARELGSRGVRANVVAPGYVKTQLTDVLPEEATAAMLQADAARAARGAGGHRRRGTLPLLRRGSVHHGRGSARRRRLGDVDEQQRITQRASARRHHRDGRGLAARQRRRDDVAALARGRVGRGRDHAVRPHRLQGALRVRGEGLRSRPTGSRRRKRGGWIASRTSSLAAAYQARDDAGLDIHRRGRPASARRSRPGSAASSRSRSATTR